MKAKYIKRIIYVLGIGVISVALFVKYMDTYKKAVFHEEKNTEVTIIPVMFLCDEATQNKSNLQLVEEFNEIYKDKYHVKVEWFTGNATSYRARLKMLNSVNELPAIVTDVGFDPAFYKLLVKNNQIIDLAPYFNEDEEWKKCLTEDIINDITQDDGKIYIMPLNTIYYSGIFWNKELFNEAGIKHFPTTWKEFWEVCDQLKSAGITPLSLHTEGTSWAPMLLATSYMGTSEEGREFMKKVFPDTYDSKSFYELIDVYKKAFTYTTNDAIGKDFDIAEKHFYLEETAMIPNGRWMIEGLSKNDYSTEGFEKKISFSAFPENVLIGSPAMSGWAVSSKYDKKVQEGAVAFLKYRNQKDYIDSKAISDPEVYEEYGQVLKDYFEVVNKPFKLVPNYQLKWNSSIQNEVFSENLPKLLNNEITPEEFVKKLDEKVKIYNEEMRVEK